MKISKDEAHSLVLRRWRALPVADRKTYAQAIAFAAGLAQELDFETLGHPQKIIQGWLVREIDGAPMNGPSLAPSGGGPAR